jgi:hypothetical protein
VRFRELLVVELAGDAAAPSTASLDVIGLLLEVELDEVGVDGLSTCWKVVGVKFVVNVNE